MGCHAAQISARRAPRSGTLHNRSRECTLTRALNSHPQLVCSGIAPALVQAPLSRFGDTAANAGGLTLMNSFDVTRNLPVMVQTIGASAAAATFRIVLVPIDTIKTIMQVEGKGGVSMLMAKARVSGPSAFFHGALATAAATFVGHWPWFAVSNQLQAWIPKRAEGDALGKLGRNAGIGFCSSVVSVSG